jgi:hypothetical protein
MTPIKAKSCWNGNMTGGMWITTAGAMFALTVAAAYPAALSERGPR